MAIVTDPLTSLSEDHQRILGILEEVRRGIAALSSGKASAEALATLRQSAQTLARELDLHSMKKEEEGLFPALTEAIGPAGPISVMLADHREVENHLPKLLEELNKEKPDAALARSHADVIIGLLPAHIQKEDFILYPTARERLSRPQMDRVVAKFRELDKE